MLSWQPECAPLLQLRCLGNNLTKLRLTSEELRLTSAAIGEVLNRVDVVIWLMSAKAIVHQLTNRCWRQSGWDSPSTRLRIARGAYGHIRGILKGNDPKYLYALRINASYQIDSFVVGPNPGADHMHPGRFQVVQRLVCCSIVSVCA